MQGLAPSENPGKQVNIKRPTLLEYVVWDALDNSRCPREHRYRVQGKSLPCRWCRTAHALILVLEKVASGTENPSNLIDQFEKEVGWTMRDIPVGVAPKF